MITSKINFNSGFDNFSLKQQVSRPQTVDSSKTEPVRQNKINNIKKYTFIGAGILLAGILIFKGKSVLNKLMKKAEVPEIKPDIKPDIKPQALDTKPQTVEPAVKPETVVSVRNLPNPQRYQLIDEYDRLTKARAELKNKTKGRGLTPEEKAESEELRQEWSNVYKQLIPQHQSLVRTKTAADFANEAEKRNYIMNYVLPRMSHSEESALDALDMFEQFGFRADYPNNSINTTITKLTEGLCALPKECKSEKVLNRYIDVFGKFANNNITKHPDDEQLADVITYFTKKGSQDISENTVVKGIELLKRIVSQRLCVENLEENLIYSYDAKFKNSQPVINAIDELKDIAKDCRYVVEAGDR